MGSVRGTVQLGKSSMERRWPSSVQTRAGARSQQDDDRIGRLRRPYEDPRYNAWLDDRHWEGGGASHQQRVLDAFRLLFGGSGGEGELRKAACLNVVPVRSVSTADLSSETWSSGVEWFTPRSQARVTRDSRVQWQWSEPITVERPRWHWVRYHRGGTEGRL